MAINSINYATNYSSITFNPIIVFPPEKDPSWFQKFLHSKPFKYIKRILFVIFILNLMGWGNMLLFISIGVANKTMPDEHTRKVWIPTSARLMKTLETPSIIFVGSSIPSKRSMIQINVSIILLKSKTKKCL
jgi:hypothetical protein